MAIPCSTLLARICGVKRRPLDSSGFLVMISGSAGCRSRTMEQVGSIISSNSTICTGSSIWAEGGVPKSGGSREAIIIGRWIVKIYPTALLMLS